MVNIQLKDGYLDVYPQDIGWSWKTVRFSEGIRDQFTNDFELPKTENNLALLDACGLLDSPTQPLGTQIEPCTVGIGDKVMDAYIQVVSVESETIGVCLYEKRVPEELLNANIQRAVVDDNNSIFAWNVNTRAAYPNDFKTYWYGAGYNPNYAQLHPSKPYSEFIQRVNNALGIEIPNSPVERYVLATRKTVCPQNQVQVIEGHWTDDSGNFAVLSGGQHITNDCEFSYSPDATTITFNRHCKVSGKIYYAYKKKGSVTNSFPLYVCRYNQGEPVFAPSYTIPSNNYASFVMVDNYQAQMKEGSELRVQCNNTNKYDMLNFVLVLTITDYTITEDDYGQELKYVGRTPRLKVYSNDGEFKFGSSPWQDMVDGSGGGYTYCWFDGTTYATHYNHTSNPAQELTQGFTLEWCSIAYFGYWCNLPEISVKDLMWGFCWLDCKKLVQTYEPNGNIMLKVVKYEDANKTNVITGNITSTRLSSDTLGRENHILMSGQETSQSTPVSTIENQWLEKVKTLHKNPFSWSIPKYGQWYCINQYSGFEHDEDSGEYKADFDDVDGFAVANAGSVSTLLYKVQPNSMGFGEMTQSVEVEVETYDDVKDLDFFYLDGHKYMPIEGSVDLESGYSTVRALLCPFNAEYTTPVHKYPQPVEEEYGNDHEPNYIGDPNDDFDPNGDHPDYEWDDPLINQGNEPVTPVDTDWDWEGDHDPWVFDPDWDWA